MGKRKKPVPSRLRIARQLISLRTERGLTQQALAEFWISSHLHRRRRACRGQHVCRQPGSFGNGAGRGSFDTSGGLAVVPVFAGQRPVFSPCAHR
jgi:hypothetical protein